MIVWFKDHRPICYLIRAVRPLWNAFWKSIAASKELWSTRPFSSHHNKKNSASLWWFNHFLQFISHLNFVYQSIMPLDSIGMEIGVFKHGNQSSRFLLSRSTLQRSLASWYAHARHAETSTYSTGRCSTDGSSATSADLSTITSTHLSYTTSDHPAAVYSVLPDGRLRSSSRV